MAHVNVRDAVLELELGWRVLGQLEAENCDLGDGRSTKRARLAAISLRAWRLESICAPAA